MAATTSTTATPMPAVVVFADTHQSLNAKDLLDYTTKRRSSIYEQGCKTLDDKAPTNRFSMTADQTVISIEALKGHIKADKHLDLKDALNEDKKTRNKKKGGDKAKQKEDEEWKRVPRTATRKARWLGSTPTIVACTTWHGACISMRTAALARKGRRNNRRRFPPMLPTSQPTPLLPLPL
jgi:hypothetical protein